MRKQETTTSKAIAKFAKEQGLELLPDNAQWKNRFEIQSESSNRIYVVSQNIKAGHWGCSCMGWIRYRDCKHLKSLKPLLDSVSRESTKKVKQIS